VLAYLSSGEIVPNPRHGEQLAGELARAARAVSRKKRGSKSRLKARRHLQAINRRIANRRRNTMDKVSKRLVTHFGTIASEVVEARKMMDAERPGETLPEHVKRRRNREALDAAPYLLRQMTGYKARLYAARHVEIDPKARTSREASDGLALQPTQRCSYCGGLHFKELTDAEHVCTAPGPYWSMRLPRKVNAAKVILQAASGRFGIEIPSLAEGDRGGPVPGGLSGGDTVVRNGRTGARRPGNTEEGQPSPGRRSRKEPPIAADSGTHARRHPKTHPKKDAGW
jgi:transposase